MKVESVKFVSIWDLDGSDVIHDMDFGLTFGDGLTLHTVTDILAEVQYETNARALVKSLNEVVEKFGFGILIAF